MNIESGIFVTRENTAKNSRMIVLPIVNTKNQFLKKWILWANKEYTKKQNKHTSLKKIIMKICSPSIIGDNLHGGWMCIYWVI